MQVSSDKNNKATDDKQKENDSKLDKIKKCMEELMDKFNNSPQKRQEKQDPIFYHYTTCQQ